MQLPPTILSVSKYENKMPKSETLAIESTPTRTREKRDATSVECPPDHGSCSSDSDGSEAMGDSGISNRIKRRKQPGIRPPRTLETTLFDRLEKMYGTRIKRILDIQYR